MCGLWLPWWQTGEHALSTAIQCNWVKCLNSCTLNTFTILTWIKHSFCGLIMINKLMKLHYMLLWYCVTGYPWQQGNVATASIKHVSITPSCSLLPWLQLHSKVCSLTDLHPHTSSSHSPTHWKQEVTLYIQFSFQWHFPSEVWSSDRCPLVACFLASLSAHNLSTARGSLTNNYFIHRL